MSRSREQESERRREELEGSGGESGEAIEVKVRGSEENDTDADAEPSRIVIPTAEECNEYGGDGDEESGEAEEEPVATGGRRARCHRAEDAPRGRAPCR